MENEFEIKREKIDWIATPVEDLKVGDFFKISPDDKDYLRIKEISDDGIIVADKAAHNGNITFFNGNKKEEFDIVQNVKLDKKDFTLLYKSKRNDIVAEMTDYVKTNYTAEDSVFKTRARTPMKFRYNSEEIKETISDLVNLVDLYKDALKNMKKDQTEEDIETIFFYNFLDIISPIVQDERDAAFVEALDAAEFAEMLDDEQT